MAGISWKDKAFLFAVTALAAILGLAYWTGGNSKQRHQSSGNRELAVTDGGDSFHYEGRRNRTAGHLITGDDQYLEPYTNAGRNIARELANVDVLRLEQTSLRDTFTMLQRSIAAKFTEMQQIIDLRRDEGAQAAFDRLGEGEGKRTMDDIRIYCQSMEDALRGQLADRNRQAEVQTRDAV